MNSGQIMKVMCACSFVFHVSQTHAASMRAAADSSADAAGYEISVQEVDEQMAAVIEQKVSSDQLGVALASCFERVSIYLQESQVSPVSGPIARYLGYSETEAHFQAGFLVGSRLPESGDFKFVLIPASTIAVTIHVGPSEESGAAYEALHQWMVENHYEAAGAPWEEYLSNPKTTARSDLKTRISYPIRMLP